MIHPTALVDGDAQIHEEADIGPYTIIGPNVEVGCAAKKLKSDARSNSSCRCELGVT